MCPGYHLSFPAGTSPHTLHPFMLHQTQNLPCMERLSGRKSSLGCAPSHGWAPNDQIPHPNIASVCLTETENSSLEVGDG
ncbi:hypothetical protein B0H34DRAFT_712966 [Crassisporium funariophilum]|nr:hypothetical protein B0H34DRAFT_712966 [Crassisporium funariophilum]